MVASKAKEKQAASRGRPFEIKDSALVAIATGRRAHDLRELRDHLRGVQADSVYYHFWGQLLRPQFENPEFNNDFAVWAKHALHDLPLAERFGVLDPTDFPDLEALRSEVIALVEDRLDETEFVPAARRGHSFYFTRGQLVVFDTQARARVPEDLLTLVPRMSLGSIYYHVIEARYREPLRRNDFDVWLEGWGARYERLRRDLAGIDPYFATLYDLRQRILSICEHHFTGNGLSAAKGSV